MQPSATPAQVPTNELDPSLSSSFQTIGKLLRVKSGSARSSESMSSPTDTSRPGFFRFLSAPPSPSHLANAFKSRRKSMAPADAFAQSAPNTAFRSRTLSHSISVPSFCSSSPLPPPRSLSDSTNMSRRRSRLSAISQEKPQGPSSGWESDSDDAPLVSSAASRKNSSPNWKQKALHKCKSMTWPTPYPPTSNPPPVTQRTMDTSQSSLTVQPLNPIILSVDTPTTTSPPFSAGSQSSTADDFPPLTPVSFNGSTLSFHTAKKGTVRSRGSLAKLARTLGVLPAELDYPNEFGEFPTSAGFIPNPFNEGTPAPPRPAGRMSLSLSTFASLPSFFRSSSHNRHRSAPPPPRLSYPPPPTRSIEDLQNFTFSNNLLNPHLSTRMSSDSPISPITFEHSTVGDAPVIRLSDPPSDVMKHNEGVPKDQSRGIVSSLASFTRVKSKTRLHGPRPMETKAPRDAPFESLPERSNWLNIASPIPIEDPQLDGHRHSSNLTRDREPARTHSGQWNQDDMQYVIKRLRTLK